MLAILPLLSLLPLRGSLPSLVAVAVVGGAWSPQPIYCAPAGASNAAGQRFTVAFFWRRDATRNIIAYGTPRTNALLAEMTGPLGLEWRSRQAAIIAVHGDVPVAITHGAHLDWQLLPDYLVYNTDRVLEWGHFDNQWRPPDPAPAAPARR